MAEKKKMTTEQEKEKVLKALMAQEKKLQKSQQAPILSEDDFVQYLNLATKKDLVSQASELTLQEIAEKNAREAETGRKYPRRGSSVTSAAIVGGVAGGPNGAVALGGAAAAGPIVALGVIGAPIAGAVWLWGKGKEVVRTFKTSYQNDSGGNRLGRALWRSVKYPFFKIPLVNKMRRDIDFMATPEEHLTFKQELKENRINGAKKEALTFAKFVGGGVLACCALTGVMGAAVSASIGRVDPMVTMLGIGATFGSVMGAGAYTLVSLARLAEKVESKSIRGRKLIEQALDYPPVRQALNVEENVMEADARQEVKAQIRSDEAKAQLAKTNTGKEDNEPNIFNRLRQRLFKGHQKEDVNMAMVQNKQDTSSRR